MFSVARTRTQHCGTRTPFCRTVWVRWFSQVNIEKIRCFVAQEVICVELLMVESSFCHHEILEYEYRCTQYEYDFPDERCDHWKQPGTDVPGSPLEFLKSTPLPLVRAGLPTEPAWPSPNLNSERMKKSGLAPMRRKKREQNRAEKVPVPILLESHLVCRLHICLFEECS